MKPADKFKLEMFKEVIIEKMQELKGMVNEKSQLALIVWVPGADREKQIIFSTAEDLREVIAVLQDRIDGESTKTVHDFNKGPA